MTDPIRLMIVDDHTIMRVGIAHALNAAPDIVVVGQAESGEEALYLCSKHHLDVMLIDVSMPGMGGVAVTQTIRQHYPAITIIGFSMHEDRATRRAMILAGANGYLSKAIAPADLIASIRRIQAGELDAAALEADEDQPAAASGGCPSPPGLAPQQRRVLALVTKGYTNAEIASYMDITVRTARHHVSAILTKLGAANRAEAVAMAMRNRLVSQDDF